MTDRYSSPDHRIRLDYIMNVIKRLNPKKVIDFGCGKTPIQQMEFNYYMGIDFAKEDFTSALSNPSKCFWERNYEEPLWEKGIHIFDLAIWSEGPEHTLKHRAVFDNVKRALKPNGFLIVTCPNDRKWAIVGEGHEHKCCFDFASLKKLVRDNGFTVLEMAEVHSEIRPELVGYDWLFCLATPSKYDPRYKEYW